MSPNFVTKRIQPCAGMPVHELVCGHIIQAIFFNLDASSKCASNCKCININARREPIFLCPQCHEAYRSYLYDARKVECAKEGDVSCLNIGDKQTNETRETTGEVQNSIGFSRFVPLVEGSKEDLKFEKAVKRNYKWKVKGETLRSRKPVEQDTIIVMESY